MIQSVQRASFAMANNEKYSSPGIHDEKRERSYSKRIIVPRCSYFNLENKVEDELVMSYYKYKNKSTFALSLELFNRVHAELIDRVWTAKLVFFECKGAVRVTQRACSLCGDVNKQATKSDLYFVNMAEICKDRTVLCQGCISRIVYNYCGDFNTANQNKLNYLRIKQRNGIIIPLRSQ